jgi:glycosyltransferase involved in cell wall biosynthesis
MIICSWELLPAAVIGKMIWGGKLLYDVQENTLSNIQHNRTMSAWKKPFAKCLVRCIESASKPFISCFLLAEQCYASELPDFRPHLVLENKFFGNFEAERHPVKLNKEQLNFLISGTLTEVYGIMDAINWFKAIQETYPGFNLRIIGHSPLPSFKQEVMKACEGRKNIDLCISDTPIAYSEILEAYTKSDVILMPYRQIQSIQDKIPSKMYESLAMGKPFLFSPNPKWKALAEKYGAGMEMEFRDPDNAAENLSGFLEETYFSALPGEEVLWKSDEKKFLDLIEKLV